jgi:hypothetical protein
MKREMAGWVRIASLATVAAAASVVCVPTRTVAQAASPFAGVWTLNRSLSELPPELGFDVAWLPSSAGAAQDAGSARGGSSGGRGRRGSSGGSSGSTRGGSPFSGPRESYEDARRVQLLTGEARNPPARLMIVDTPSTITITNELGQSRALHPDGKEESIDVQGVPLLVTTKRDGDRLVVVYRVEQGREVRYTYSHAVGPPQLIVEVEFLDRGAGDKARRVYEPGVETTTSAAPAAAAAPAATAAARDTFDARPGAELKGLRNLGILVEDLGAQAVACGLNRDTLEASVSKRLTDGGFTVRRNSDDDTYVYVNVITNTVANGVCVSRYDVFLYTHATAKLSYRDQPVLVQVSLMHRGGIGSSAASAHPAAVARALENYVDLLMTQIRDANR